MEREAMDFDVVIVGAGPAGLSAAIKLKQLAAQDKAEITVAIVEKASEVGAHILSGAVLDPRSLDELIPDWKNQSAPINAPVSDDEIHYLLNTKMGFKFPNFMVPKATHNEAHFHVVSMANVCRWLAQQAEALGVDIFPGFAASEILYDSKDRVVGIATGDMGLDAGGEQKGTFARGYELRGKYTLFAEGCRGHLGKQLMQKYHLQDNVGTQHYGLGIKEVWQIDPSKHQTGKVVHAMGWPLSQTNTTGGGFLYHLENNQVTLGLIINLGYKNPYLDPFEEMQRFKTHPLIKHYLDGGKRIAYGARSLVKGGLQAVPKLSFPGGLLCGDDAGFMNFPRIKGNHTAMKSGMLVAETVFTALQKDQTGGADLVDIQKRYEQSWLYQELHQARNTGPALHKLGMFLGAAFTFFDQMFFRGRLPFTLQDPTPDYAELNKAGDSKKVNYPKADGVLTFSRLDSVFLSNTNHEEDQPCHLQLTDPSIPIRKNLPDYDEPAQRYCPAGVYEIVESTSGEKQFQINAQNCVHCKTCDIKDPAQNITWVTPEGGGGPNYPNM